MKPNNILVQKHNLIFKASLISLFLLLFLGAKAQTPTNFSGKWEFDKVNSDKEETGDASFDGTIILEINQNSDIITFTNSFIMPGQNPFVMPPDKYFMDGRVTQDNSGTDPAKKFVKWSTDRKSLNVNLIMTVTIDGVAQDFITVDTYKLSDDGKTLVVENLRKSKLNGEKTVKKVYNKK